MACWSIGWFFVWLIDWLTKLHFWLIDCCVGVYRVPCVCAGGWVWVPRGAGLRGQQAAAATVPGPGRGLRGQGLGTQARYQVHRRIPAVPTEVNRSNSGIRTAHCICKIPMIMKIRRSFNMRLFASYMNLFSIIVGISQMQWTFWTV